MQEKKHSSMYLCRGITGFPGIYRLTQGTGKRKKPPEYYLVVFLLRNDPYGIRTRVTAVKGRCLNRLTNGPYELVAAEGLEPTTFRV